MKKIQLTEDEIRYGIRELFLEKKRYKGHIEVWHLYHAYMFEDEAIEDAKFLRKIQYAVYRARVVRGPLGRYAVYYIKEG